MSVFRWVGVLALLATAAPAGAQAVSAREPTVLVVVEEKVMGVFDTTGFEEPGHVEGLLDQELLRRGFVVLDLAEAERRVGRARARQLLEGDEVAAREVALQAEADFILSGTATAKPAGTPLFGTNMKSLQANVVLRLIRSDGRVIGAGNGQAAQAHLDEVQGGLLALTKATEQAVAALASSFDQASQADQRAGAPLTVQIKGLVSYRHLDFLLGYLQQEMQGVDDATLRSFHGGVAELAISSGNDAAHFARAIGQVEFRGFSLDVTHVSPSLIEMEAVLDE